MDLCVQSTIQFQMEKDICNDGTQWSIVHSITGTSSVPLCLLSILLYYMLPTFHNDSNPVICQIKVSTRPIHDNYVNSQ